MKKVKYNGTFKVLLPTLNLEVNPGDVINVPDDFKNANFEDVKQTTSKPADKPAETKEANK